MTVFGQLNQLSNSPAVTALTWTLFHSLWQGVLVAILTGIIISATKRAKPVLRYQLLCLLLLLLLFTSVLTFWYQYHLQPQQISFFGSQLKQYPDGQLPDHLPGGARNVRWLLKGLIAMIADFISQHTDAIAAVWLVFFLIKSVRIGFALGFTAYIRQYRSAEASPYWTAKLDVLRTQLSVAKPVLLLESALLTIPVVYGHLKPVILIPLGLLSQLPPGQIEAIVVHELMHIRRNDYLVNLLQQVSEVVFFFNPALLWLSACIREEREYCCDELAIAQLGHRRQYAEALIRFKELSLTSSPSGGIAFTGTRTSLLSRISRIVTKQNHPLSLAEKSALFICGLALIVFFGFYKTPSQLALSPVSPPTKQTNVDFPLGKVIAEISEDLLKEGIVQTTKGLSFELTNTGLQVGGVRQPAQVWQKLYNKYLKFSPYPIKPDYRNDSDFGIYYNAGTYVFGIGTKPPAWKNYTSSL
ncbi:M56 family metallopeptidase [Spirosoma endbachense]|uniref:Peptidase M56 domain-containing protein n=1 Tax=Spirosoma endbachense TaxID=2666025 RepID=A0A6P1VU79_9BACT|nr:M56 family metallopeptidase [Spirosoma endbachense]QHV95652.1 hypothetical protein GJR95_11835 [Spirosoma endbachense]